VENLDELCGYPLLFSQGIHNLETEKSTTNLAEYLRRGGFLLIDSCINRDITPDPDDFLAGQLAMLGKVIPEAKIVPLPGSHEVYRCFFSIGTEPPHTFHGGRFDSRWARHGLYGIHAGNRMVGLISLSGLQCGWDRMPAPAGHDLACMRMLVNIYIYAMLQGS